MGVRVSARNVHPVGNLVLVGGAPSLKTHTEHLDVESESIRALSVDVRIEYSCATAIIIRIEPLVKGIVVITAYYSLFTASFNLFTASFSLFSWRWELRLIPVVFWGDIVVLSREVSVLVEENCFVIDPTAVHHSCLPRLRCFVDTDLEQIAILEREANFNVSVVVPGPLRLQVVCLPSGIGNTFTASEHNVLTLDVIGDLTTHPFFLHGALVATWKLHPAGHIVLVGGAPTLETDTIGEEVESESVRALCKDVRIK